MKVLRLKKCEYIPLEHCTMRHSQEEKKNIALELCYNLLSPLTASRFPHQDFTVNQQNKSVVSGSNTFVVYLMVLENAIIALH